MPSRPRQTVRKEIGAFAVPDVVHWAPGLPKTRSGDCPASRLLPPPERSLFLFCLNSHSFPLSFNLRSTPQIAHPPLPHPRPPSADRRGARARAGKILRRVLRRIANGLTDASELGDVSTMADPGVVTALIKTAETAN